MRRYVSLFAALATLFLANQAFAQGAACPIAYQTPQVKASTVTTYTVQPSDQCSLLYFMGASVAVTLPNANTLPAGFTVFLNNAGTGTMTVTPTTSAINGASTLSLNQGGSIEIFGNNVNYYTFSGAAGGGAYLGAGTNIIENGDFLVDQEYAGASETVQTSLTRSLDRWFSIYTVSSSGGSAPTSQQVAVSSGLSTSLDELKFTASSSASTSTTAGMITTTQTTVEGADMEDLGWGTSSAVPVTVSLWMKDSIAGANIGVSLKGATIQQSYVNNCVLSATASTWTYCSFTVPGPTTGTWSKAVGGQAMSLLIALQCGTTFQTTADTWATGGPFYCTSAQTQQLASASSTLEIALVKMERGSQATAFVPDAFPVAFTKDRRYYRTSFPLGTAPANGGGLAGSVCEQVGNATSGGAGGFVPLDPPLFATPTITTYNPVSANANWRDVTGSVDVTVSVDPASAKGLTGFGISETSTPTVGHTICVQYAADAAL